MSFFFCDQAKAFPSQTPNGFSNSNEPDVSGGGGGGELGSFFSKATSQCPGYPLRGI